MCEISGFRDVVWWLVKDVSGQHVGPFFKVLLGLADHWQRDDTLSRKVGKQPSTNVARQNTHTKEDVICVDIAPSTSWSYKSFYAIRPFKKFLWNTFQSPLPDLLARQIVTSENCYIYNSLRISDQGTNVTTLKVHSKAGIACLKPGSCVTLHT
jgi:hypothetical protein